ncbi:protein kinase domain-containing protein [Effusibacillus consociatus]|uniref:Protein kinase domain-containing protein n=1 Tax=Effusibacillus consociatus TaxID=1117041 RepID=A0ABV9PZ72_9BACL
MGAHAVTSSDVRGRWNGRSYRIIRTLGSGANGQVYLALENNRKYALKLSTDATGIALEYRLLRQLQNKLQSGGTNTVQGFRLGPFVSDLDDAVMEDGKQVFFYTMEYIAGIPVSSYIRDIGFTAIRSIALQLLDFLQQLHEIGYAFGDLKAENVLVNPITGEVRLVDFGGATRLGEGIRQYTEWYDRATWHTGSRRAESGYDLFAAAMLLVKLLLPDTQKIIPGRSGFIKIRKHLSQSPATRAWLPMLEKAWRGGFRNARQMRVAVLQIPVSDREGKGSKGTGRFFRKIDRELSREWDWSHWLVIGSAVLSMSMVLRLFMVK